MTGVLAYLLLSPTESSASMIPLGFSFHEFNVEVDFLCPIINCFLMPGSYFRSRVEGLAWGLIRNFDSASPRFWMNDSEL